MFKLPLNLIKEMFKIFLGMEKLQELSHLMLIYLKVFRQKARFVAEGHKVEIPASIIFSTVLFKDCVRIPLMVMALNYLDIQGADVQQGFLSSKDLEK